MTQFASLIISSSEVYVAGTSTDEEAGKILNLLLLQYKVSEFW